jgi:outer membrane protein TolC
MIHAFIVLLICTQIAWSAVPYLALQDALAMGKSQSVELRMQNSQKKLSNLQVENALAGLLPTLTLQSDASRTDLPFTQYRDQTTIRNTLALQWIVFDGMSTRTSIEIARKSADVNTAKNAATTLQ